jgi:hypothetical protein
LPAAVSEQGRAFAGLERRAPSRLEGDFPSKLAEAVLGVPVRQTIPPPFCRALKNFNQVGHFLDSGRGNPKTAA